MKKLARFALSVLNPLVVYLIGGLVVYDHVRPPLMTAAPAAVDGRALGSAYAPVVASCLAEGWLAAADTLERGEGIPQAQATLQATWESARARAFAARVVPEFSRVLPDGTEPTDPARRAEVVRLWRDFASGLKGGR